MLKMKKQLIVTLVVATLSFTAINSQAKSYFGVSFGTADYSDTSQVADSLLTAAQTVAPEANTASTSIIASDSSFSFFYGYKLAPTLAVELSYNNLGTAGLDGTIDVITGGASVGNVSYDVKGEITSLGLTGVYWFDSKGSVKPFVKLGYHSWELDALSTVTTTGTLSNTSTTSVVTGTASGTDLLFGVGINFEFSDALGLRLEYESFDIGSNTSLLSDISVLSAGLNYKF